MEKIIGEMNSSELKCNKDYKCYKSSLEKLCNAEAIGTLIECGEKKEWWPCGLSFPFGYGYFCKCPLRRYIAQYFS